MRYRSVVLLLILGLSVGCSSYQPTKNVWKGTKSLWYTYASPPASVDYSEKGDLSGASLRLTQSMFPIDAELSRFERVMLNADKPPSQEWITNFLINFPWMNGIAGVKYDGTILGQEPPTPVKELDFIPLLYEDPKQRRTALRGDVQITPQGPELMLAAPLYESSNFLGIVCAHFDMRTLATQFPDAQRLVILTPFGLLWAGQYDFAKTPLAGLDWEKVCRESTAGTCANSNGKFIYQVRFLGNLPVVFAVAESDSFPKGDGSVAEGLAFFPKRPKLPPPPQPERVEKKDAGIPVFGTKEEMVPDLPPPPPEPEPIVVQMPMPDEKERARRIEQENKRRREFIRQKQAERRRLIEQIQIEEIREQLREQKPVHVKPDLDLGPDEKGPTLPGGRPSPFATSPSTKTVPDAPKESKSVEPVKAPEQKTEPEKTSGDAPKVEEPKLLPGGRPNPFGS